MNGATAHVAFLTACRFRLWLWLSARTLPFRIVGKSFEQILAISRMDQRADFKGLPLDYVSACVRKAVRRPWLMRDRRCLREGLLGFEFLTRAGYLPELHFALDPASLSEDRIRAHCWVCLDGEPVIGDRQGDQVTIFVHRAVAAGSERAPH